MKKILLTGLSLCLTASMATAAGLNFQWSPTNAGACQTIMVTNATWDCTLLPSDVGAGDGANDGFFYATGSVQPSILFPTGGSRTTLVRAVRPTLEPVE
jgi:hypothetical protein